MVSFIRTASQPCGRHVCRCRNGQLQQKPRRREIEDEHQLLLLVDSERKLIAQMPRRSTGVRSSVSVAAASPLANMCDLGVSQFRTVEREHDLEAAFWGVL